MKNIDLKGKAKPSRKRIKKWNVIILAAGAFFFALIGLGVWGGITVVKKASQLAAQTTLQELSAKSSKTQLAQMAALPQINAGACLAKAQELLTVEAWTSNGLQESLTKNIDVLKQSCLGAAESHAECMGNDCSAKTEGETI